MRPTGNWSPALTDRVTDFFLGPPALRPAAPFLPFAPAPVPETSIADDGACEEELEGERGVVIGDAECVGDWRGEGAEYLNGVEGGGGGPVDPRARALDGSIGGRMDGCDANVTFSLDRVTRWIESSLLRGRRR